MQVEFGNAGDLHTNGTGWFIGFSEWTKSSSGLRHVPSGDAAKGLCVKWFLHEAGDPNGDEKPISEGRTISMLVGEPGDFKLEVSSTPAFELSKTVSYHLRRPGDFVAWGSGLYHRAYGLQQACILTVRWIPEEA